MGSASDLDVMVEAARELERMGVPYEVEVTSAHRSPDRTATYVRDAEARGVQVFIAAAGMAAHLAGAVAAQTTRPVLGVPLGGSALDGHDALLSTVQMPRGVPVGTLAIGKHGAANAALLACQILALADLALAQRLTDRKREMTQETIASAESARKKLKDLLKP
ncbi:MAG: 5-(carboxyamino)imidazole ribonucleotide mutase [Acidobacteria bacterium]|nr:5-(carboxyamino)imidazole ribonucleotide mutase [Acidobacteriota bacterium]